MDGQMKLKITSIKANEGNPVNYLTLSSLSLKESESSKLVFSVAFNSWFLLRRFSHSVMREWMSVAVNINYGHFWNGQSLVAWPPKWNTPRSHVTVWRHMEILYWEVLLYLQIRKFKCLAVFANTVCTAFVSCLQTVVDCLGTMNLV